MKLGFIGLGAMGKPMAENIAHSDHQLFVFDINSEAVDSLVTHGASACSNPKELASQTDIIMMSLPNSQIVEQVLTRELGVLAVDGSGKTIVDFSSVSPQSTRQMAVKAKTKGFQYMDAPISGGVTGAINGTLTIMTGGEPSVFEDITPILEIVGTKIKHIGEIGSGDAVKIINNMLLGANMAALAEALVLGKKAGLSAKTMKDIIGSSSGQSYVLDSKLEKFILERNFSAGFAIDLQYKDLELAIEMAKHYKAPLPATNTAQQIFDQARAEGYGQEDISAVVKVWESLLNIKVSE